MIFGKSLKMLRNHKNMTQEESAAILDKSTATVGGYERGETSPEFDTLVKIIEYFKVDANIFSMTVFPNIL